MPQPRDTTQTAGMMTQALEAAVKQRLNEGVMTRVLEAVVKQQLEATEAVLATALKERGFTATLKSLNKGRLPTGEMKSVVGGVVEELPSGLCNAALETDQGRVVLRNALRTDRSADPQLFDTNTDLGELTADALLRQLSDAGPNPASKLLCAVELTRFNSSQNKVLLPLLWRYPDAALR